MTQEQKDRIDREARNKFQYGGLIRTQSKREGYIAGATAEHERAEDAIKLLKEAQALLTVETEKAWELVNALEWIKTYGPVDDLTKKFIDNALQKWEGKEVLNGK